MVAVAYASMKSPSHNAHSALATKQGWYASTVSKRDIAHFVEAVRCANTESGRHHACFAAAAVYANTTSTSTAVLNVTISVVALRIANKLDVNFVPREACNIT